MLTHTEVWRVPRDIRRSADRLTKFRHTLLPQLPASVLCHGHEGGISHEESLFRLRAIPWCIFCKELQKSHPKCLARSWLRKQFTAGYLPHTRSFCEVGAAVAW